MNFSTTFIEMHLYMDFFFQMNTIHKKNVLAFLKLFNDSEWTKMSGIR